MPEHSMWIVDPQTAQMYSATTKPPLLGISPNGGFTVSKGNGPQDRLNSRVGILGICPDQKNVVFFLSGELDWL